MVLDEKEKEFVSLLVDLGTDKQVSKTLVSLANDDWLKSKEIQKITDLSQPEVSMAINDLKKRGFLEERMIEREKRGRPEATYSLNKSISEVMEEIKKKWRMEKQKERRKLEKAKKISEEFSE